MGAQGLVGQDDPISPKYKLPRNAHRKLPARTEQNVIESDATLIIVREK